MVIKYTNFSDGIHQLRFEEPVGKLGLEELFFGQVVVNCKMDKSIHQIVLTCDVEVNARLTCDRCSSGFEKKIGSHFLITYLLVKSSGIEDDLNVKYLSPEEDKINISADTFEYIKLAMPMKALCDEECKGLCPVCGISLNENQCGCRVDKVNDVWEPLKKLKFKN